MQTPMVPLWLWLLVTLLSGAGGAVVGHLLSARTFKRETVTNAKRDAYYAALEVWSRRLANAEWSGPQVPPGRLPEDSRPRESELNHALAKVALFTDDRAILETFRDLVSPREERRASPALWAELLTMIRKDMGYGRGPVTVEKYPYIYAGASTSPPTTPEGLSIIKTGPCERDENHQPPRNQPGSRGGPIAGGTRSRSRGEREAPLIIIAQTSTSPEPSGR